MKFTKRQQEVIELILKGLSNYEIGEKLFVSEKTIDFHLLNIYKEAQVHTRANFILKYMEEKNGKKS